MKTGSILVPGSGKMGGLVWSHNKGGPYIRTRTIPTNPNSSRQQAVRSFLAQMSVSWELLTDEQRNAWNSWAVENPLTNPIGNSYVRTGHQAYTGLNARLLDAALPVIDDPPSKGAPLALISFTVSYTDGDSVSVAYSPALSASVCLALWMSLPQAGEGNPNFAQARLAGYSALTAPSPIAMELPFTVTDSFVVNFWGARVSDEGMVGVASKDRQRYTAA